jgi:predicted small metal-binding protein
VTIHESSSRGGKVGKVINCECGRVVTGDTDDELVSKVEDHVVSDHPELVGKLSREDILAMAEED